MKRNVPLTRRTPIRKRSSRQARKEKAYGAWRQGYLAAHPDCEAHIQASDICTFVAEELHHIKPRSQGGPWAHPDNAISVCRACHRWIHAHPASARHMGLLA